MKLDNREEIDSILRKAEDFLKEASRDTSSMQSQQDALVMFAGNFWSKANVDRCHRKERANFHCSAWRTLVNNVTSKVTNSPWHVQIKDDSIPQEWHIQDLVNEFESKMASKAAQNEAFKRAVACGAGYVHIISDGDHPRMEVIKNQTCVYIDPWAQSPDLSDAEECVIVQNISKRKAERDYGFHCNRIEVPAIHIYPQSENAYLFNYYAKENGKVVRYDICGEYVDKQELPTDIIPVIRFAGYECMKDNGAIEYRGIVQMTEDLQASTNIAFSTMQERMSNSPSSTLILASANAMGGSPMNADGSKNVVGAYLQQAQRECMSGASNVFPYAEGGNVSFENPHFNTDDLTSVMQLNRTLMEDVTGINLQGMDLVDKTASEVLVQENNKDAAGIEFFMNAEASARAIAKIILQCLCGGQTPVFELENGPAVLLEEMKQKQKFALIAEMAPQEAQGYLASKLAEILKMPKDIKETLAANVGDYQVVMDENEISIGEALNRCKVAEGESYAMQEQNVAQQEQIQSLTSENERLNNELTSQKSAFELQIAELKAKIALVDQPKMEETDAKTRLTNAQADKLETETAVQKYELASQMGGM